ncbi:hypothetical protein E4U09_000503 [Claviceps aff. purpurea]|uniref:Phosphatidylglycerol/phosphatidylinositol transfer protein n=1 Tax=Claviceps aff. purpurea TaxID=1967640 RepID=A0A9P7U7A4_9HYPO|nr:hypothetical protein E4U09_000503 [Claviceps aff. purpurea]
MRVSAAILFALMAPSAALSFRNVDAEEGISSDEDLKIPGHSTIELCPDKKSAGFFDIERIDFAPNPPVAGQALVVNFRGIVTRRIEKHAFYNMNVNYGLNRLLGMQGSFCSQITAVDLKCPLMLGRKLSITKTITLPKKIPPGNYTVTADVFNYRIIHYVKIIERITCVTTTIKL